MLFPLSVFDFISPTEAHTSESVNTQIADAILEAHLRVARVGTSTRNAALRVLALLEDDLVSAITLADPAAPALLRARQLILQQLLGEEIRPLVQTRYETIAETAGTAATRLAVFEAQNTVEMINAVVGIEVLKEEVAASTVRRQVRETLLPSVATRQELSATASTWWTRQAASLEQRVYDQINVGIVQGENIAQLTRRLRGTRAQGYTDGVMEISRRDATRLVRTQFNSVANTAQLAVYDANPQSIRAIRHLSTLDSRTSPICIGRSGLQYTVPEHNPLGHSIPFLGGPAYHWGCRSVMVPVVAGAGPSTVETFEQFLRRRGAAFQDEVLGPGRARLWREGKLTSTKDLLDAATGRPLTLEELGA